jgi:hypothetical protein
MPARRSTHAPLSSPQTEHFPSPVVLVTPGHIQPAEISFPTTRRYNLTIRRPHFGCSQSGIETFIFLFKKKNPQIIVRLDDFYFIIQNWHLEDRTISVKVLLWGIRY